MYIFNLINDFSTLDVIILILVIFIFIFLVFLTSSLMKKNRELREELSKNIKTYEEEIPLKKDNLIKEDYILPETTNNKITDNNEEETIINNKLISDIKEEIKLEDNISTMNKNDIDEMLDKLPVTESGPYKKNILREINTRSQTSPVNIGNVTVEIPKVKVTSYVKKEEYEENNKSINNSNNNKKDYLQEISEQIEKELEPQTIELTDYEKQQEEEAIISYQELLKTKDNNYKITDDEEIDSFIDELKKFRTDLE